MQQASVVAPIRGLPCAARLACAAALGAVLAGCGSSSSPASAGMGSTQGVTNASSGAAKSTNWSGYVRTGGLGGFKQVGGSWTVPQPDCSGNATTASSIWPGIGGYETTDQTLIQAGTEQDCSNGSASYYAWWEGYPAPSQDISSGGQYPVHAGDHISVSISNSALLLWSITIDNSTAGWSYTTTTPFVAAGQSAEWILEAPLQLGGSNTGPTTLANVGKVPFSGLTANSANAALGSAQAIDMVNSAGSVLASPSAAAGSGDAFDVCYGAGSCN